MLIKCPKCQIIYEIDDSRVSPNGLKMHCNKCGEIFKAYPEDAVDDEKTAAEKKLNILNMFKRFAGEQEDLFRPSLHQNIPVQPSKVRIVHLTHYKNNINCFLILIILFIITALLYFLRYDVVRFVPNTEKLYQKLGIESVQKGFNLQFMNINTQEIVVNNVSKIKITGIINNLTPYQMTVLPIKVIVYNQNGEKLLDTTHYLPQTRTRPNYKLPFEIIVTNPTPNKKNIHITFANNL